MTQPAHLAEARDRAREGRKRALKRTIPPGYDPLGYCPTDRRKQLEKRAELAVSGSLSALIDLACIHCMGWQPTEVKRCTDPYCPLWIRATRHRPEGEET